MSKRKKFYAIKIGKNNKNIIVSSWEECLEEITGFNSIYKGFNNKEDAQNWLNSWKQEDLIKRLKIQQYYSSKRFKNKENKEDKENENRL